MSETRSKTGAWTKEDEMENLKRQPRGSQVRSSSLASLADVLRGDDGSCWPCGGCRRGRAGVQEGREGEGR